MIALGTKPALALDSKSTVNVNQPTQQSQTSAQKQPSAMKNLQSFGGGLIFGSQTYVLTTSTGRMVDIGSNQTILMGQYSYFLRKDWGMIPLSGFVGFGKNNSTSTSASVTYRDLGSDIMLAGFSSGARFTLDKWNVLIGPELSLEYRKVDFQSLTRGASIENKSLFFGYGMSLSWRLGKWTIDQSLILQHDQAGRSQWKLGVSYFL